MPSALPAALPRNGITKFTNCRLVRGNSLVQQDLWVSAVTGTIIDSQASFYDDFILPDETVDLGNRILSPGLIECQLNGAFGFNFSTPLEHMFQYKESVAELNRQLAKTGVTSYVPTVTSQRPEVYRQVREHVSPMKSCGP